MNTPELSSSQFNTPALDSEEQDSYFADMPFTPKKPPDAPGKSAMSPNLSNGNGKRRLSVSFAEKVSYTFFRSPPSNAPSTADVTPAISKGGLGLGLQRLPLLRANTDGDHELSIREQANSPLPIRPQRTKSDDEVVRAVHRPLPSSSSRLKLLNMAATKPEAVMLGFLWMLYLSWLASAGL
jgi:hypothetical protein